MVDCFANGEVETRMGNRSSYAAPHGVFPCKGEDRWCAIAVFEESEWRNLCQAMGNPEWSRNPKFGTLVSRKKHEDELESLIGQWTKNYDRHDLMTMLQEAGVPAGAVQDGADLVDGDPHLQARRSFVKLTHPVAGERNHPTQPVKLSENPSYIRTSPCLGEHNGYVYKEYLRLIR